MHRTGVCVCLCLFLSLSVCLSVFLYWENWDVITSCMWKFHEKLCEFSFALYFFLSLPPGFQKSTCSDSSRCNRKRSEREWNRITWKEDQSVESLAFNREEEEEGEEEKGQLVLPVDSLREKERKLQGWTKGKFYLSPSILQWTVHLECE